MEPLRLEKGTDGPAVGGRFKRLGGWRQAWVWGVIVEVGARETFGDSAIKVWNFEALRRPGFGWGIDTAAALSDSFN